MHTCVSTNFRKHDAISFSSQAAGFPTLRCQNIEFGSNHVSLEGSGHWSRSQDLVLYHSHTVHTRKMLIAGKSRRLTIARIMCSSRSQLSTLQNTFTTLRADERKAGLIYFVALTRGHVHWAVLYCPPSVTSYVRSAWQAWVSTFTVTMCPSPGSIC